MTFDQFLLKKKSLSDNRLIENIVILSTEPKYLDKTLEQLYHLLRNENVCQREIQARSIHS
jgi:hypothetical protein